MTSLSAELQSSVQGMPQDPRKPGVLLSLPPWGPGAAACVRLCKGITWVPQGRMRGMEHIWQPAVTGFASPGSPHWYQLFFKNKMAMYQMNLGRVSGKAWQLTLWATDAGVWAWEWGKARGKVEGSLFAQPTGFLCWIRAAEPLLQVRGGSGTFHKAWVPEVMESLLR